LRDLREGGYELHTLGNLKEKHIKYLVDRYAAEGLKRGTLENIVTYLRTLAVWLGKFNLVKAPEDYEAIKLLPRRSGVTLVDKSWEGKSIDAGEKIAAVAQDDPHVGIQLLFQITFGLRTEEAMLLRPKDCLVTNGEGKRIFVSHGTKGGRPRFVPVTDDSQLEVLRLAEKFVNRRSGTTIPDERKLVQWKNRYYYILDKHQITKAGIGATAHGLRHEYLQGLYKAVTGEESAIKGGEKPRADLLTAAKQIIVEAAGHSDPSKSNAYLSSHTAMRKKRASELTDAEIQAAIAQHGGNKMKASAYLDCSRSYLYERLRLMSDADAASAASTTEEEIF
jgi:integrase